MFTKYQYFSEPKKVTNVSTLPTPQKVLGGKKILQKPVKTVATKVSNDVTDIGFLYKNPELVKGKNACCLYK